MAGPGPAPTSRRPHPGSDADPCYSPAASGGRNGVGAGGDAERGARRDLHPEPREEPSGFSREVSALGLLGHVQAPTSPGPRLCPRRAPARPPHTHLWGVGRADQRKNHPSHPPPSPHPTSLWGRGRSEGWDPEERGSGHSRLRVKPHVQVPCWSVAAWSGGWEPESRGTQGVTGGQGPEGAGALPWGMGTPPSWPGAVVRAGGQRLQAPHRAARRTLASLWAGMLRRVCGQGPISRSEKNKRPLAQVQTLHGEQP